MILVHQHQDNTQQNINKDQEKTVLKTVIARVLDTKSEVDEVEESMS